MLALRPLIVAACVLGLAACDRSPEPVEATPELLRRAKHVEREGLAAMVPDAVISNRPVKRFVSLTSDDDLALCGEIDGRLFIWSSTEASGTSDAQDHEWSQACVRPVTAQAQQGAAQPS